MKRYFTVSIVAVACLVAALCGSCSAEEPISTDGYTYTMRVDAVLNGFDGSATRSAYDWPDGAKLYVQFHEGENRVQGFAEYSESNDWWTVTTRTGLSNVGSGTCEAYYFEHSAEFVDVVELSENVAVYQDVAGSYICDANGLFVSLALTPRTGRIRFCGEVGRSFTVSGLTHLSTYEILSNNFSSTSKSLSLTVSEDGYTPYLYASFPEASRTMVIVDGDMEYTRECTESVLAIGKSGCMTIPTTTAHDGWTVDESAVADAIDLGLSVKWASCNVGADSPEDYGDYFAWGETTTKSSYSNSSSLLSDVLDISISGLKSLGIIDANGNLTAAYDAATVNWGDEWRMPTSDEIKELVNNCTWRWTTQNGVYGYKVVGPNGNSIFLPAAGNHDDTEVSYRGSYGYYWSATPRGEYIWVYSLYFSNSNYSNNTNFDFYGFTVRPVYGPARPSVSVTTGEATDITDYGATLGGIVSNSDEPVTCGIIYDISSTLSSTSGTMLSTSSSGEFSIEVTGLSPNTTYYYCAYVEVDGEYKYGEVLSFTTESETITVGDAIDLGLSVKWASWNVGATAPEEFGGYYAWGEVEEKDDYSESTYLYYQNGEYVHIGADISGTEYDVAHVKWGDGWRMPTKSELQELCENCSWNWTTQNGVNGYKVIGSNGNSIFLPAAGDRYGTEASSVSDGFYWSSSLVEGTYYAYLFYFYSRSTDWSYRYGGLPVRPVTE